jgi:hypothetical protein
VFESGVGQDNGFAIVDLLGGPKSPLVQMLLAEQIVPGSAPSYEMAKTIFAFHPLGATLTAAPITLAQSQPRQINVPVLGEKRIVAQFQESWDELGRVGGTVLIHNWMTQSRVYGISSLGVGERGKDPSTPLDMTKIADADLFFNVFDPLNTAGSLVLNQDPNSPDFLKPQGISVNGKAWHPSRTFPKLHEQALYIEWSSSAYGFVGRSIYQRALFPLKTYLQTLITDQWVTQKAGLLVYKAASPGSFIDNVMQTMFGWKRGQIKAGVTGQVLQIGIDEDAVSLNMQNLDKAAAFARDNCLKNIATAAGMPAAIVNNETLAEGFGEGTEDAKTIARFLDYIRQDMGPAYAFVDRIVQRKAWTPAFYESLGADYPEYRDKPFDTAIHEWTSAFTAIWPNLLTEPDSEKAKNEDVKFKAVLAMVELMGPMLDPENKAKLITWACENLNEAAYLFASKLMIDEDTLMPFLEENREAAITAGEDDEPRRPMAFEGET